MNLKLTLAGIMLLLIMVLSGCAYYGSYGYGYSDYDDYYYGGYHPYYDYGNSFNYGNPFGYHRDRDGN